MAFLAEMSRYKNTIFPSDRLIKDWKNIQVITLEKNKQGVDATAKGRTEMTEKSKPKLIKNQKHRMLFQ